MTDYLYRVQILAEPEFEQRLCFDTYKRGPRAGERYNLDAACPVEWEPTDEYIEQFGTDRWIEPATDKVWRARSSAALRRDILVAAGFWCIIQRSAPVQWPEKGQDRIEESAAAQVLDAMAVLSREGLVTADELLRGRKQRP